MKCIHFYSTVAWYALYDLILGYITGTGCAVNWNSRCVHAYHSKKVLCMWNMTLHWLFSTYPGYTWLCPLQDWWWTTNEMLYFKCTPYRISDILRATVNGNIREENIFYCTFIGSQVPGPHLRGEGLVTSAESLGSINVDCFLQTANHIAETITLTWSLHQHLITLYSICLICETAGIATS